MANVFLSNYSGANAGQSVAFNPQADVLAVNNSTISAADLQIGTAGTSVTISATDDNGVFYQVRLTNVLLNQLDSTNVQLFDGSRLLIGDNSPQLSSVPDDVGQTINATGTTTSGVLDASGATTAFDDQVQGLGGADTIDGGGGSDLIYGNLGDDSITGTAGFDTIYGGKGNDLINYSGDASGISAAGNIGNDTIYGGSGNDLIFGNQLNSEATNNDPTFVDGNDLIYGNAGSDTIYGNQGEDTIVGTGNGFDFDVVYGGRGNDVINYSGSSEFGLTAYGNLGNDTIYGSAGFFETIYGDSDGNATTVSGVTGNDVIIGAGSVIADVYAGFGNDLVNYSGLSTNLRVEGGVGSDTIYGSNGGNIIYGGIAGGTGDSADLIYAGTGNDLIYGNQGNDTIIGSAGAGGFDTVYGGEGNDQINYSLTTTNVIVYGGVGNDVIYGGTGADTLVAGDGADALGGNLYGAGDVYDFSVFGSTGSGSGTYITGTTNLTADSIVAVQDPTLPPAGQTTAFFTGTDQLVTGFGEGTSDNYQEFANAAVTDVASAYSLYTSTDSNNNPVNTGVPSYTFIAGATDGYLIVDNDGFATNGATGVLRMQNLGIGSGNSEVALSNFDFSDIIAQAPPMGGPV